MGIYNKIKSKIIKSNVGRIWKKNIIQIEAVILVLWHLAE